jgi:hypothetical protein
MKSMEVSCHNDDGVLQLRRKLLEDIMSQLDIVYKLSV